MFEYEKTGVFYLGKIVDPKTKELTSSPLLYKSKNFTTHAVCLGMTGSGKTGLGITIIEEAAMDRIPAIIIDPKGDLSNLLLSFPNLSQEEFQPWIDQAEAERSGLTTSEYAQKTAKNWEKGLLEWDESTERIRQFRDRVEMLVYTPASQAGIPLSILSSFEAPKNINQLDPSFVADEIQGMTSSLLGLLGINADPIKSREHILISHLIQQAWSREKNLSLPELIQQIQNPPVEKIGALDINTFYPSKDRKSLAISLNNLLASPSFQTWLEGEPLDIDNLLTTKTGKPRLSILSIAHLGDSERMFFVTLLLNKLYEWMQKQAGTSSLRALLYMDEIFGYFPPTAMPPSKLPMLKLLKQARAFGLGIVLSTQNPADLDYKGLSNCGTWFIGKLQTERDQSRVLEGLNIASNGNLDTKTLNQMLAALKNRVFIMRSIYEAEPVFFETRWTMSYLRGPLTLKQIQILMEPFSKALTAETPATILSQPVIKEALQTKPFVPSGLSEFFVQLQAKLQPHYKPFLGGFAKLHFMNAKNKIDTWKNVYLIAPSPANGDSVDWTKAEDLPEIQPKLTHEPLEGAVFENLPASFLNEENFSNIEKSLITYLYQNQKLTLYSYSPLKMTSSLNETEKEFRSRVALNIRENRDEAVTKIREKFAPKIKATQEKIRRTEEKIAQKQQQANEQKTNIFITILTTILGALFGKKITKGTINSAGSSIKKVGKLSKENQTGQYIEDELKALKQQSADLQKQQESEINLIPSIVDPQSLKIEEEYFSPKKADIFINQISIIWWPF